MDYRTEYLESYRPGELHPVHLEDRLRLVLNSMARERPQVKSVTTYACIIEHF